MGTFVMTSAASTPPAALKPRITPVNVSESVNFCERREQPPRVSFSGDDYSEHAKHLWAGNPAQLNPRAGESSKPPLSLPGFIDTDE